MVLFGTALSRSGKGEPHTSNVICHLLYMPLHALFLFGQVLDTNARRLEHPATRLVAMCRGLLRVWLTLLQRHAKHRDSCSSAGGRARVNTSRYGATGHQAVSLFTQAKRQQRMAGACLQGAVIVGRNEVLVGNAIQINGCLKKFLKLSQVFCIVCIVQWLCIPDQFCTVFGYPRRSAETMKESLLL